jgi:hypothetical protein
LKVVSDMNLAINDGLFQLPWPKNCGAFIALSVGPDTDWTLSERTSFERIPFKYILIPADQPPTLTPWLPSDIHPENLKWLIGESTLILVWRGDGPYKSNVLAERLNGAADRGNTITILRVLPKTAFTWLAFARRWRKQGCEIIHGPQPDGWATL